jgi:hypothetical protein
MATTTWWAKQGDTDPPIVEALSSEAGPINLTGSTVLFRLWSLETELVVVTGVGQVQDALNGVVSYVWAPSDLATAGKYLREWEITLPSGRVVTVPNDRLGYPVVVSSQLG